MTELLTAENFTILGIIIGMVLIFCVPKDTDQHANDEDLDDSEEPK